MILNLKIPDEAKILVKEHEQIEIGEPLYELGQDQTFQINIADRLHIKPQNIFQFLNKVIGESVKAGELLASKKGVIKTTKVFSPQEAIIKEISHINGIMTLLTSGKNAVKKKSIKSYFNGKIKAANHDHLLVEIKESLPFEVRAIQCDFGGETVYLTDKNDYYTITADLIRDRVVITSELTSHLAIKCEAIGAAGFLFLKAKVDNDIPDATISSESDFKKIIDDKKKFVLISKKDGLAVFYD
ncbi:hypothetical protein A3J15_04000 [Candidatus Roizmanbacteria bacterium RIFCSPLOWO2_02_FULL_38_10]|uniref:Uncharacterized protein n=1 Tax=Candidatus Roizmanbacteria bacterium RIFCSPLOWO2_02_FULL_38_10 TaxID=1802074 RepID=A0A1F7JJT8_9BACT|nr:MAG: hypothetical protein A3J15_04000 [Candidatus Roizmanbacteria bacterium RIFCSPLOWO2_02_FULL_38_10]